jgi:hypothetical protein
MTEIKNFAASVRAKLLTHAKATGANFDRVLVRYGVERFLYRLSQHHYRDRFILKGAMLFLTWPEGAFRPTGDLDLLGHGPPDPDALKTVFAEICSLDDPRDGLTFDIASIAVEAMREDEKYRGVRMTMFAYLEKTRIRLQIDVGFGDAVHPDPRRITFPCLLPGMTVPEILAYPAETVIAEKFEAMVRFGEADGRMKDFNDIWAITRTFEFEMATLVQALLGTFQRRETAVPTETPVALTAAFANLPAKQTGWASFLKTNPPAMTPPPLEELLADLRRFFDPLLRAAARPDAARGHWDPLRGWGD